MKPIRLIAAVVAASTAAFSGAAAQQPQIIWNQPRPPLYGEHGEPLSDPASDRAYWEHRQRQTQQPDVSGMTLPQRANYCHERASEIDRAAVAAMNHLLKRNAMFSPSTGYLSQSEYGREEREIKMIATVAYRDLNTVRYGGADIRQCDAIYEAAKRRIEDRISRYP